MLPNIWGSNAWKFIHSVTLDYPVNPTAEDKENYANFFKQLQYVLPCAKCRYNLSQHLKKYPLTQESLANRNNLVKWAIDLHNIVNYYTGKPMLTYQEAINEIRKYTTLKRTSMKEILNFILIIMAVIIICSLLYLLFKKKK